MSAWDVVGAVGAIWLAVSILAAVGWALIGKRIFRQPPAPSYDGEQGDARIISFQSGGDVRGGA